MKRGFLGAICLVGLCLLVMASASEAARIDVFVSSSLSREEAVAIRQLLEREGAQSVVFRAGPSGTTVSFGLEEEMDGLWGKWKQLSTAEVVITFDGKVKTFINNDGFVEKEFVRHRWLKRVMGGIEKILFPTRPDSTRHGDDE